MFEGYRGKYIFFFSMEKEDCEYCSKFENLLLNFLNFINVLVFIEFFI